MIIIILAVFLITNISLAVGQGEDFVGPPNPNDPAQMQQWSQQNGELKNPLGSATTFELIVNNLVKTALGLSGVFALLAFIYGGITWMTSMGDPAKVTKAKNMMAGAVIGLFIIFASYAIITLVFTALGVGGGSAASSGGQLGGFAGMVEEGPSPFGVSPSP